jgi:hypothetical protein
MKLEDATKWILMLTKLRWWESSGNHLQYRWWWSKTAGECEIFQLFV